MVEEIASRVFSSGITVTKEMLANNNEIIYSSSLGLNSTRCNAVANPQRVCIGAASISITSSRAESVDFLTSYYLSGLRMIVKVAPDFKELALNSAKLIGELFITVLAVVVFIIFFITPIVWVCEMKEPQAIFYPRQSMFGKTNQAESDENIDSVNRTVLKKTFFNALKWTTLTFGGIVLAAPKVAKLLVYL